MEKKLISEEENIKLIDFFISYMKEKYGIDYKNDPKYIGMMYYGSRLTGYCTKTSDLDLCIVCDSTVEEEYKGVVNIDGIEVEYVEKPEYEIYLSAEDDYAKKNVFAKSAYSRARVIFDKNGCIANLKEYINDLYSKEFELSPIGEILDNIDIMNSRFIDLLNRQNDNTFNILYYVLLDFIKNVYHKMKNITKLEVYKTIRAYLDPEYQREALCIESTIDQTYKDLYLKCINSEGLTNTEKIKRLYDLISYITKEYYLYADNFEFETHKSQRFCQSKPIIFNEQSKNTKLDLTEKNNDCIKKFVELKSLQYRPDYIGMFIYKSSEKEIEMIVLFNSKSNEMLKGACVIDGVKIKYVMVHDKYSLGESNESIRPCVYRTNLEEFLIPNNIQYSIVANENNRELVEDYVSRIFDQNFSKISDSKYESEMIVIDNRMKRLKSFIDDNTCNYFDLYYYIVMYKMINVYRNKIGSCYIDPNNLENKKFLEYYNALLDCKGDRQERFDLLNNLYKFLKGNIEIYAEERVKLAPRYKKQNQSNEKIYTKKLQ